MFLRRYWREILIDGVAVSLLVAAGVGGVSLAQLADSHGHVSYLPSHPDRAPVFLVGLGLTFAAALLAAVRNIRKTPAAARLRELEDQVLAADRALEGLSDLELSSLFEQLKFSTDERISLFLISDDRTSLRLVARHALSQGIRGRARPTYPIAEGCIGRAYGNAVDSVLDLPDPQTSVADWQRALRERCGIPEATSAQFRMRSRTCIAFAVQSGVGPCHGVIAFESRRLPGYGQAVLDVDRLRKRLKGEWRDRLLRLLELHSELDRS